MGVVMNKRLAAGAAMLIVAGMAPAVSPIGTGAAVAAQAAAIPFDFDGDGYADLAVGVPGEDLRGKSDVGAVQVMYGSASGVTARDQLWHQGRRGVRGALERGDQFGEALASGDFDADGYADLAIGIPREDIGRTGNAGAVQVLYGGPGRLTARDQIWHQGKPGVPGANEVEDLFGHELAVGDFDSDGFADLAVGIPGEDIGSIENAGAVTVLRGSRSGLTSAGSVKIRQGLNGLPSTPGIREGFGADLAAGDVNGDGHADLVVIVKFEADMRDIGDTEVDDGLSAVHVILGSPAGVVTGGSQFFGLGTLGFEGMWFIAGRALHDVNGDGSDDLALTVQERGIGTKSLAVLHGHADGLDPAPLPPVSAVGVDAVWASPFNEGGSGSPTEWLFGQQLAVGDVTGDGHADVAMGATRLNGGAIVAVAVLPGTASGLATSFTDWSISVPDMFDSAPASLMQALPLSGRVHEWLVVGWPATTIGPDLLAGAVGVLQGTAAGTAGPVTLWHQDSPGIKGGAEAGDLFGVLGG
jgi:hypothetical protein